MPYVYEYVPADVAVTHAGVTVYHAYDDDNYNDRLRYWYSMDEENDTTFDIRNLPNYRNDASIEEILREAIELEYIVGPDEEEE